MKTLRIRVLGVVALFALAVSGASVASEASGTPEEVVDAVVAAYLARDVEAYTRLLADDFVFVFHPEAGGLFGDDPPPSWDRETEETVHRNMLEGAPGHPTPPDFRGIEVTLCGDPEPSEAHPGLVAVSFNVDMDVWLSGRPAPTHTGQIIYLRQAAEVPGGWEIARWEEVPLHDVDGVWERTVTTDGVLYWYGHSFSGAVHFVLDGLALRINGQELPLHEALGHVSAEGANADNPRVLLEKHARATARSFDEWVAVFQESDIVEEVIVGESSIRVNWVGLEIPRYVTIIYRPEEHDAPRISLDDRARASVERVAGYLERGFDVWVHGFMLHARLPGAEGELPEWAVRDMEQPLEN